MMIMDRNTLLAEVKRRLQDAFGERFRGLVLYGSEARGEATSDSDIDLLVLLEGPVGTSNELRRSVDALYPLQLEVIRPIHAFPIDVAEYEKGSYALYRTAQEEGLGV